MSEVVEQLIKAVNQNQKDTIEIKREVTSLATAIPEMKGYLENMDTSMSTIAYQQGNTLTGYASVKPFMDELRKTYSGGTASVFTDPRTGKSGQNDVTDMPTEVGLFSSGTVSNIIEYAPFGWLTRKIRAERYLEEAYWAAAA